MRVTIIPSDNAVYIDGVCKVGIDMSSVGANVSAVQWYDTQGEIEWTDQNGEYRNDQINSIAPYQSVIDQWYEI